MDFYYDSLHKISVHLDTLMNEKLIENDIYLEGMRNIETMSLQYQDMEDIFRNNQKKYQKILIENEIRKL